MWHYWEIDISSAGEEEAPTVVQEGYFQEVRGTF